MNILLISEYIRRLTKKDIINYTQKEGINLTEKELDIIYNHIKNDYKEFLTKNPIPILNQLKEEVTPKTYNKVLELYDKYYKLIK